MKRFVDSNEFMQHTGVAIIFILLLLLLVVYIPVIKLDSKIKKVGLPDVGELSRSKTVTALMGGTNKLKREPDFLFYNYYDLCLLQRWKRTIVNSGTQIQFLICR